MERYDFLPALCGNETERDALWVSIIRFNFNIINIIIIV